MVKREFPRFRPRRMRRDDFSRRLMRETHLSVDDLIYPMFLLEDPDGREEIDSMPGIERLGLNLVLEEIEELVRLRDHGVSADLVGALRGLSVARLDTDDIVRIRDHGVSTAYVSGLRDLGYAGISAEELVRLRSHGVSTDFIRRVNGDGARRSPDELVALRNGGFASN